MIRMEIFTEVRRLRASRLALTAGAGVILNDLGNAIKQNYVNMAPVHRSRELSDPNMIDVEHTGTVGVDFRAHVVHRSEHAAAVETGTVDYKSDKPMPVHDNMGNVSAFTRTFTGQPGQFLMQRASDLALNKLALTVRKSMAKIAFTLPNRGKAGTFRRYI